MPLAIQAPLIPDSANTPLDARTVVNTPADILKIELPYEGMLVYCKSNKKVYKVTQLKALKVGPITANNCAVSTYEEFAGVSTQSDWDQSDSGAYDYIKNKPIIPEVGIILDRLKTVTNNVPAGEAKVIAHLNDVNGASELTFEFNIPAGPAGPKGDKGDVPIKGTDYWTEADQAAIYSYIDSKMQSSATTIVNTHMDNIADNGAW